MTKLTPEKQLADLLDSPSGEIRLTDWEIEFVDSVDKQTRDGKAISAKQATVIGRIWDDAFIHGKRTPR